MGSLEVLQQGARQATGEKLDYTFYDTIPLSTGVRDYRFFALALGQGSPTPKNKSQTNMRANGQIPQGHNHQVQEIWFDYTAEQVQNEAALLAYYQFLNTSTVTFAMPGKDDFGVWKLSEIAGAHVKFPITPAVAGDNSPVLSNEVYSSRFKLSIPVTLPALESFEIKLELFADPNAALVGDTVGFGLRGHLIRLG